MSLTIATRAQDCLPGDRTPDTKMALYVGADLSDVLDSGGFGHRWQDPDGAQPINVEKRGMQCGSSMVDYYGSSYRVEMRDNGWKWISDLPFRTKSTNYFHVKMEDADTLDGFGGFCWDRLANAMYVRGSFMCAFGTLQSRQYPLFEVQLYEANWNEENGGGVGPMQTWIYPNEDVNWETSGSDFIWPSSGVNAAATSGSRFSFRIDNDKIESFNNNWSTPEIRIEALPNNYQSGGGGSSYWHLEYLTDESSSFHIHNSDSESGGTGVDMYGEITDELWANQHFCGAEGTNPAPFSWCVLDSNTSGYELPLEAPTYGSTGWTDEGTDRKVPAYLSHVREIDGTSYVGHVGTDDNYLYFGLWVTRGFTNNPGNDPELQVSLTDGDGTDIIAFTILKDTAAGVNPEAPLLPGDGQDGAQGWGWYGIGATDVQAALIRTNTQDNDLQSNWHVKVDASGLSAGQAWKVAHPFLVSGPIGSMGFLIPKYSSAAIIDGTLRLEMTTNSEYVNALDGSGESVGAIKSGIVIGNENAASLGGDASLFYNRNYGPSAWAPIYSKNMGPGSSGVIWNDRGIKLLNSAHYDATAWDSLEPEYLYNSKCVVAADLAPFKEAENVLGTGTFRFRLNMTNVWDAATNIPPTRIQPDPYNVWGVKFYYVWDDGGTKELEFIDGPFLWKEGDSDSDGFWTMTFGESSDPTKDGNPILRKIISENAFLSPQPDKKWLVMEVQCLPDGWSTYDYDAWNEGIYLFPNSLVGTPSAGITLVGGDDIPAILNEDSDDSYIEMPGKTAFRVNFPGPTLKYDRFNTDSTVEVSGLWRSAYSFYSNDTSANAKYGEYRISETVQGPDFWPNARMDWGYYLDDGGSRKRLKNTNNGGVVNVPGGQWMAGAVDGYTSEIIWKEETPGGLSPTEQSAMTMYLRNTSPVSAETIMKVSRARIFLKPFSLAHINFSNSYVDFIPG